MATISHTEQKEYNDYLTMGDFESPIKKLRRNSVLRDDLSKSNSACKLKHSSINKPKAVGNGIYKYPSSISVKGLYPSPPRTILTYESGYLEKRVSATQQKSMKLLPRTLPPLRSTTDLHTSRSAQYQAFISALQGDSKQNPILGRLPRQFLTFVQDALEELQNVTNTEYEGQVLKGVKSGQGQLVFPNGDVYKGNFKNNQRNGQGVCLFSRTGQIYRGDWRDGKPMGNGILFTLPNEIFEGRFNGFNIEDGHFKLLFTNGEYYEGSFKFGQRNANGQHYYRNGDFYDGEWQNDRRIGRGKVIFRDGGKLTAMFIEDKADGYAEMED